MAFIRKEIYHATRYNEENAILEYRQDAVAHWRIYQQDSPRDRLSVVGPSYPTRDALLRDLPRYAVQWGYDVLAPAADKPNGFLLDHVAAGLVRRGYMAAIEPGTDPEALALAILDAIRRMDNAIIAGVNVLRAKPLPPMKAKPTAEQDQASMIETMRSWLSVAYVGPMGMGNDGQDRTLPGGDVY